MCLFKFHFFGCSVQTTCTCTFQCTTDRFKNLKMATFQLEFQFGKRMKSQGASSNEWDWCRSVGWNGLGTYQDIMVECCKGSLTPRGEFLHWRLLFGVRAIARDFDIFALCLGQIARLEGDRGQMQIRGGAWFSAVEFHKFWLLLMYLAPILLIQEKAYSCYQRANSSFLA